MKKNSTPQAATTTSATSTTSTPTPTPVTPVVVNAPASTPAKTPKKKVRSFMKQSIKIALVVLAVVLVICIISDGYYIHVLRNDVASINNRTTNLERGAQNLLGRMAGAEKSVTGLTTRLTASESIVTQIGSRVDAVEQAVANLFGRADGTDVKIDGLGKGLAEVKTSAEKNAKDIGAVKVQAEKATRLAAVANQREASRTKAENQKYMTMMSYIRGANPSFELCSKSSVEVEKLLNDGVWNIEPQIESEFVRLTGAKQQEAAVAVTAIQETVQNVKSVADKALDAGETAVSSLGQIAGEKSKPFGFSVSKKTKKSVSEDVAEYNARYSK